MKTLLMMALVAMGQTAIADAKYVNEPLVMIATVKVKAGFEEQFKAAAQEILAPTRAEAGNIQYDFHQSPADPTEFATFEIWRSQADIDSHMSSAHMQRFFSQVGNMFEAGYPILKTYQKFEE